MLPPKNRSRYLPTLTQVVAPTELAAAGLNSSVNEVASRESVEELRVQEIAKKIMPAASARMREILQEMLDERLHQMEANLQLEVESLVRHAMVGCEADAISKDR